MKKSEMIKKFKDVNEKYGEALARFDFAWKLLPHFMRDVKSAEEMRKEIIDSALAVMVASGNVLKAQEDFLEAHGVRLRARMQEKFTDAAEKLKTACENASLWKLAGTLDYTRCANIFRWSVNQMLESSEDIREVQDAELEKLCEEGGAK